MKKTIVLLLTCGCCFGLAAQENLEIKLLRRKIDSLQFRLDEKNYTRIPNSQFESELNGKIKDEVAGWFTKNFWIGGTIMGGLLLAVLGFMATIGRKWITKEMNETLEKSVSNKTNDIKEQFKEHRQAIKDDFKEIKESFGNKFKDLSADLEKQKKETSESLTSLEQNMQESIRQSTAIQFEALENKLADFLAELNEIKPQLFIQSVNLIAENAKNSASAKKEDEDQIRFLEKQLRQGSLPNDKLAGRAVDSILTYYYYSLQTDKMIKLIDEYGEKYPLSASSYVNAALAFLDKFELQYQPQLADKCVYYCEEGIKKIFDYGTAFAVMLELNLVKYQKAYDEQEKVFALQQIQRIFHRIHQVQSKYLVPELIARIKADSQKYMGPYINLLYSDFKEEWEALQPLPAAPGLQPVP